MGYPAASTRAFQYGLIIFTLTALLGLANATQLFGTLDRNTLLTHLHSGTLGWITMGVIGLSIWIFGGSESALCTERDAERPRDRGVRDRVLVGQLPGTGDLGTPRLLLVVLYCGGSRCRALAEGFRSSSTIPKLSDRFGLTTALVSAPRFRGDRSRSSPGTGSQLPPDEHGSGRRGACLRTDRRLPRARRGGLSRVQLRGGGRRTTAGSFRRASRSSADCSLLDQLCWLAPSSARSFRRLWPGIATLLSLAGAVHRRREARTPGAARGRGLHGGRRYLPAAVGFLVLAKILEGDPGQPVHLSAG